MRLTSIKKNLALLRYDDGLNILFAYEYPVAAKVPKQGILVTDRDLSDATYAKVMDWLTQMGATTRYRVVPQAQLFDLIVQRPVYKPDAEKSKSFAERRELAA